MSYEQMHFLTGPKMDEAYQGDLAASEPEGKLTAVLPLSKVQQPLWLDYLRRPSASHYHLTLKVYLHESPLGLETILQVIHRLGTRHSMLRTTFHLDSSSDDIVDSYMAIHCAREARQTIEIVTDPKKLHKVLRQGFDLSSEYPVRWVLLQDMTFEKGKPRSQYTLYVVAHHIAVDGSSMSHISKEILQELEAQGSAPREEIDEASAMPLLYGDYILRQAAYLRSPEGSAAKKFWISQLSRTRPITWALPAPDIEETKKDYRQIDTWTFFSNTELHSWSESYKTSWFRIATSIVGLVVNSVSTPTPHHDQALLVAFGGRKAGYETSISHMANTMPIKIPLSSLPSNSRFIDLVKEFGKSMSTAKRYETYPFMRLVDEIRKLGHDEQLDLKVSVTFSPKLASSRCKLYPVEGVWDLFFCFLEQEDGVSLGVISNPEVFDDNTLSILRRRFTDIMKLSRNDPTFHLSDLEHLQDRELATLVSGPSILQAEDISSARVHHWIKARAASQPHLTALSFKERGMKKSYGALAQESSKIAHYLQQQGIRPGDAIMLHLKRDFDAVLWILGVLEAGACFIILEKSLPVKRKQAIIRVSKASLLITDTKIGDELVMEGLTTIIYTADAGLLIGKQPETPLAVKIADNDLAYIVFTSGSTGEPKGVMIEHSNLSHYVSAARQYNKIGPSSNVLQFATFAFDASVLEWALCLSFGATLCFVEHPQLLVGDYLTEVISRNNINFFHTTPSVLSTIPMDKPLPTLRAISVGGEASSAGLLDRWRQRVDLLHSYGPTETTVIVTVEPIYEDTTQISNVPSPSIIGKPFQHTEIMICEEDSLESLPAGTAGEICIVGPQVARGYIGQIELTKSKFHEIHRSGRTQRLYRTGDRGFITTDGKLSISGRMNSREVKFRGYRADLYQIEKSILDQCPEVVLASVQVYSDSLVAFVVPDTIDCETVRQKLRSDVPLYCVPSRILAVNALPLNANGKIDHASIATGLAVKDHELRSSMDRTIDDEAVAKPSFKRTNPAIADLETTLTDTITKLWMEILGVSKSPSVEVAFYDAGGHSILLTALHKALVLEFPTSGLRLLEVFKLPTIRKQAQRLAELLATKTPDPIWAVKLPDMTKTTTNLVTPDSHLKNRFAIIGMAGLFPGADNVDDFWDLMMAQGDGITTMEDKTTSITQNPIFSGGVFVPRWGIINGLQSFNHKTWDLSEAEAKTMDPQKLLFLDVAAQALRDANITLEKDLENTIGTFVGAAANTFQYDPASPIPKSAFEAHHRVVLDPNISTFTAYKLNLTGPNMTVNTACSSSVSALYAGLNSLRSGDCSAILVGGTSVVYPREGGYVTIPGQVFSPSGKCSPLDSGADGSVPADAVAALVIKPLETAILANDRIYAVIEGYALGTDGAVSKTGFPVPSSEGQSRTIAAAIRSSSVDVAKLKYVELHGSGTFLGDALEMDGLEKAFDLLHVDGAAKTYVGSNKGNFGNAETASGILSLIKASIALDKGIVPPLRQLDEPNPECNFEGRFAPLTRPLTLNTEDRIGVTSLGYGGTNTHVVLASRRSYN